MLITLICRARLRGWDDTVKSIAFLEYQESPDIPETLHLSQHQSHTKAAPRSFGIGCLAGEACR